MPNPITNDQKVQIRKYCGYPMFGGQPVQDFGWRYFQQYGTLEFRMINLADDEATEIQTNYLVTLPILEMAVINSGQNLDTAQAAVWYWNKNEIKDRVRLYNYQRYLLCAFIGVPTGPMFSGGGNVSFQV